MSKNNILVNEHERACISDMGQAFLLDHVERNFTNAGGSTPWTAPELFQYSDSVLMRPTFETDVYAFACTVVEVRMIKFARLAHARDSDPVLSSPSSILAKTHGKARASLR
jgi:hypothetical protein